jgi:hypothetical protein
VLSYTARRELISQKSNKNGTKDTPGEGKAPAKKRGRPAGAKNGKKGKKNISEDEIDVLPEEDRKKADIQDAKATQTSNPRWTQEEANKAIDWITSPEVWPTWKDKQAANFVKVHVHQYRVCEYRTDEVQVDR